MEILVVDDSKVMREMVIACMRGMSGARFTQAVCQQHWVSKMGSETFLLLSPFCCAHLAGLPQHFWKPKLDPPPTRPHFLRRVHEVHLLSLRCARVRLALRDERRRFFTANCLDALVL